MDISEVISIASVSYTHLITMLFNVIKKRGEMK